MPKSMKQRKEKRPRMAKLPVGSELSYKNSDLLASYVTEQGAILPRQVSGLTAKQQRQLAREVKRARHLALLPFTQTV